MLHHMVQDIQAKLRAIAEDATLLIEANFVKRTRALDTLEFHILDRIENRLYEYGYQQELAELQHHATLVWQRLEAVNDRLFQRLRKQIVAGDCTASVLRQRFDTYAGHHMNETNPDPIGYDCLDVFVDGLLSMRGEPQETRALVSGMIGYQATPARFVLAMLEQAHLGADDVFYDLGSGLGRVALLAGLLTTAQIKGIEFEPAYCAYAQQRACSFGLTRVSFINVDARQADYTDGTVFFMYTPFTGRMLEEVLERLRAEARTRPITVATYGPCTSHVAQQSWLQATGDPAFYDRDLALFASR
jgi:hypothetical protein